MRRESEAEVPDQPAVSPQAVQRVTRRRRTDEKLIKGRVARGDGCLRRRLWPQPSAETAVTARDAAFYQFFVGSPSARHALYGLRRDGGLIGYFCLAFAPHVAR